MSTDARRWSAAPDTPEPVRSPEPPPVVEPAPGNPAREEPAPSEPPPAPQTPPMVARGAPATTLA